MSSPIGRRTSSKIGTGETFEVYITKYALTPETGIICGQAQIVANDPTRVVLQTPKRALVFEGEGVEWHRTLDGARAHVHALVKARLGDLTKQLATARRQLADALKMEARPV